SPGLGGNNISVSYVSGTGADTTAEVIDSVTGGVHDHAVVVHLASTGSTAKDVAKAVNNDAKASRLVHATLEGDGSGMVAPTTSSPQHLTDGADFTGSQVVLSGGNGAD